MKGSVSIRCIAIVNRGEAAMRCIRAVKALRALEDSDLEAIALFTAVDRDAPFVRHADRSLRLATTGAGNAVAAYLDHDGLLATLAAALVRACMSGRPRVNGPDMSIQAEPEDSAMPLP